MPAKPFKTKFIKHLSRYLLMLTLLTNTLLNQSLAIDYKAEAASLPSSGLSDFNQNAVNNIPGYQGTNIDQANYYNNPGSMEDDGISQAKNDESANLANDVFYKSPEFEVNRNEEWLQNAKEIEDNPSSFVSIISSTDNSCSDVSDINVVNSCNIYSKLTEEQCSASREIDVESYHQYQCFKDKKVYEKNCTSSLNLVCGETHYTLPPVTYNNFEAFSFSYPYINIGSGKRVGQNCSGYIYEFKFKLDNLEAMEAFKLKKVSVDDVAIFY